jgi:O-antigen/teichoic acid export membrane protein
MKKSKIRVFRTANWLFVASILTKVLGPVFFILGTRTIGRPDDVNPLTTLGTYGLAASLVLYSISFYRWVKWKLQSKK